MRPLLRKDGRIGPEVPLFARYPVLGLRKRRDKRSVMPYAVPANVIEVQVRIDDNIDFVRAYAEPFEVRYQMSTGWHIQEARASSPIGLGLAPRQLRNLCDERCVDIVWMLLLGCKSSQPKTPNP